MLESHYGSANDCAQGAGYRAQHAALAHAIAQQELEGLTVPEEIVPTCSALLAARSTGTKPDAAFSAGSRMTKYSGDDPYVDAASVF